MKVYITAPYTEKSVIKEGQIYGEIKEESFKNFLYAIESVIQEFGFSTFLPHRDIHEWGKVYIEPEEVMKKTFDAIKECDLFVTCPEYSKGPNVELGMAVALEKKSIIIQNKNEKLSLVHAGLNGLAPTSVIQFNDIMDMKQKLRETISKELHTSPKSF